MTIEADIEKLLTYGQMALEQGWHSKAREYFEQVLAVDATNQEAVDGLARVNEILSYKRAAAPIEAEIRTESPLAKRISLRVNSAREWIRKERKEYADRVAERKRLEAEKREEQAREIGIEGLQKQGIEPSLHHLEVNWVCPSCRRQSKHMVHTTVSRVDCPSCNRDYQIVIGRVVGFWVTSIPSWLPFTPWDWACTLRIRDLDGVQRNVRFIVSIGEFTPQSGDLVLISYKRQKPKLIQNYTAGEYCPVQNR